MPPSLKFAPLVAGLLLCCGCGQDVQATRAAGAHPDSAAIMQSLVARQFAFQNDILSRTVRSDPPLPCFIVGPRWYSLSIDEKRTVGLALVYSTHLKRSGAVELLDYYTGKRLGTMHGDRLELISR